MSKQNDRSIKSAQMEEYPEPASLHEKAREWLDWAQRFGAGFYESLYLVDRLGQVTFK